MNLFPTYIEESAETTAENAKVPKEYEVDLETGQLTGRIVEGLEAIKIWIWLTLQTARYRYHIYSWDYGNEFEELIGKGYTEEYLETEAKRMMEDCLLINENIKSVSDFSLIVGNEKLQISFTANTIYGDIKMNSIKI